MIDHMPCPRLQQKRALVLVACRGAGRYTYLPRSRGSEQVMLNSWRPQPRHSNPNVRLGRNARCWSALIESIVPKVGQVDSVLSFCPPLLRRLPSGLLASVTSRPAGLVIHLHVIVPRLSGEPTYCPVGQDIGPYWLASTSHQPGPAIRTRAVMGQWGPEILPFISVRGTWEAPPPPPVFSRGTRLSRTTRALTAS